MLTVGALTALPLPGSSGALTATTVPVPPVSLLLQDATADDLLLLHPRSQWDQRPLAYSQHGATATSTATSSTSNTASAAWSLQLSRHATTIEAVHDKQHDTKAAAVQYREVVLQQQQQQQQQDETDPRLSSSLSREPGAYEDFVKGRTTFKPFMPGGMEDDVWRRKAAAAATTTSDGDDTEAQTLEDIKKNLFGGPIDSVPPGFTRGLAGSDRIAAQLSSLSSPATAAATNDTPVVRSLALSFDLLGAADEWMTMATGTIAAVGDNSVNTSAPSDAAAAAAPPPPPPASQSGSGGQEEIELIDSLPAPSTSRAAQKQGASAAARAGLKKYAQVIDVRAPFDDFHQLVPNMAHKYPFELDIFQKRAVYHLEKGESVFVAAHTSAGKTVVAEYAIALAQRHLTRAVYTSPIKALSNQKFRDFKNTFGDVGLLTGDVQINPEASCLVMTTEILRSMLYRGADLIRDVEWVIFDEVHYINDQERGVVWEEVIIMLPAHVGIILLSATVPNTIEFADWIGRTKQRPIYVISTLYRPVPLEYNLFVNKELFKIVNSRREFQTDQYTKAVEALKGPSANKAPGGQGGRGGGQQGGGGGNRSGPPSKGSSSAHGGSQASETQWVPVVDYLRKNTLLPTVVFTFSKRRCDSNAAVLTNTDLTTAVEKSQIHLFVEASLKRLKGLDSELPQVLRIKDLLRRGIAVHHGGLLPIIKEMVEILFSKGLVKVLFATETFAMGVNMPARSVVFSGLRKPDGKQGFRDLLPGEFTQMAGRAGRRGLDPVGTVILPCFDDILDTGTLSKIMLGEPTKLESKFRLTYLMILNLLRVEELRVQDMMKRSFSESRNQAALFDHQSKITKSREALDTMPEFDCAQCQHDLQEFYDANARLAQLNAQVMQQIMGSAAAAKAIGTGRVVIVNNATYRNALAVVVKTDTRSTAKGFTCFILVSRGVSGPTTTPAAQPPMPFRKINIPMETPSYKLDDIALGDILIVGKARLKIDNFDPAKPLAKESSSLVERLMQLALESKDGLETLNPVKELKMNDIDFVELYQQYQSLADHLSSSTSFQCVRCPNFPEHYARVNRWNLLKKEIADLEYRVSDQNLQLLPDYEIRLQVLKALKYVDERGMVLLKGRVACEISNGHELLITELILENVLDDLDPEEIVALLSIFVFEEKSQSPPTLTDRMEKSLNKIMSLAQNTQHVQQSLGLSSYDGDLDPLENLKSGLVEVVYEWARGRSFKQIMDLTDVAEGSIVRCIVRLHETCRNVRNAAKVIGNSSLGTKLEEASALIKRDIVFAASLYH